MSEPADDTEARLDYLLRLDIASGLPPLQRLLLGILKQAVLDYFGDDRHERATAAYYFVHHPLYHLTLRELGLPPDTLPAGIDPAALQEEMAMTAKKRRTNSLSLETLVRELSGSQLKLLLAMGLLPRPASPRRISQQAGLSYPTVMNALPHLALAGLVERTEGTPGLWLLPPAVDRIVQEVWDTRHHEPPFFLDEA